VVLDAFVWWLHEQSQGAGNTKRPQMARPRPAQSQVCKRASWHFRWCSAHSYALCIFRKFKTLENYKFYLAFENLGVADYVSEKVYEGLIAGTLPVYRGAEGISKFLPAKKSIINANQMSARDIADLLLKLSKDEDAYNEYFAYKKEPLSDQFNEIAQRSYCHPNALCRLCDYGLNYRKTHPTHGSGRRMSGEKETRGNVTNTMRLRH
jgi:hypothetical protein